MSIYTFVKYDLLAHTKLGPEKTSLIMLLSFAHRCHGGVASTASNPPSCSRDVWEVGRPAAAPRGHGRGCVVWHPAVVVPAQSSFSWWCSGKINLSLHRIQTRYTTYFGHYSNRVGAKRSSRTARLMVQKKAQANEGEITYKSSIQIVTYVRSELLLPRFCEAVII